MSLYRIYDSFRFVTPRHSYRYSLVVVHSLLVLDYRPDRFVAAPLLPHAIGAPSAHSDWLLLSPVPIFCLCIAILVLIVPVRVIIPISSKPFRKGVLNSPLAHVRVVLFAITARLALFFAYYVLYSFARG